MPSLPIGGGLCTPSTLRARSESFSGVANHRSIAWAISEVLHNAGARLAIAYQNERVREGITKLVAPWEDSLLLECDVSSDDNVAKAYESVNERFKRLDIIVHSIAFANREDLGGPFLETGREGFRLALDISAYSLVPIARYGAPLMRQDGGSILTMTFQASERVFPGYNVMGTAKAALENEVKPAGCRSGAGQHPGKCHFRRSPRYPVLARHQPIQGHEKGPRRALPLGAQHHGRRGGQDGPVPMQRPLQRRNRRGGACRHRL